MFELRRDPIVGRQVLIAESRAGRPNDFVVPETSDDSHSTATDCPFCAGHEQLTPESLLEVPSRAAPWQVRVVPNKFPAVSLAPGDSAFVQGREQTAAYEPPLGAHEVVIESPRHVREISELTTAEFASVLGVYRTRLRHWLSDDRIKHVSIFKNVGRVAGASLEHVHSQLIALPEIPPVVAMEVAASQNYFDGKRCCVFCDCLEQELANGERIVIELDRFVAFCAYAGRQPYETWILPRQHTANFADITDKAIESLAEMIQDLVRRLRAELMPLSYNLILHSAPAGQLHTDSYHWHFELVPRSTQLAGFEWGTGMYINPVAPERAAARLREVRG